MNAIGDLFNSIFLIPIINLLIAIYKILENWGIPGALGFAIIILTLLIRGAIWPLMQAQLKSSQRMMALRPMLDELKKKHKDNKMELQRAQMQLYKDQGINPMAGCLPTLLQFPILIALYQAIINVFPQAGGHTQGLNWVNSILYNPSLHLDKVPDANFFGLDLAEKPSAFMTVGVLLILVPVITGVLTFVQSKMMMAPKTPKIEPDDKPKEVKEKEDIEDMMVSMQGQMVYMMPVMIGFFAFQFPVGLALYWNTLTIIGIIQQYRISGWGAMVDIFKKFGIVLPEPKSNELTTRVKVERGGKGTRKGN